MRYLLLFALFVAIGLQAQSYFSESNFKELGPMQFRWEHRNDRIHFEVISPDDGWLLLGLNQQEDIVGSSLFVGGRRDNQQYFDERYVTGVGENSSFAEMGWSSSAKDVSTRTTEDGRELLRFSLPIKSTAEHEYDLSPGQSVWFILAYSVSDDLDHHSRFRQHIQLRL